VILQIEKEINEKTKGNREKKTEKEKVKESRLVHFRFTTAQRITYSGSNLTI
jgi:hypothetical protein